MNTKFLFIPLFLGMLLMGGCSGGNDQGQEGSVIGQPPGGNVDDAGSGTSGEDEGFIVLDWGSGFGDDFVPGAVKASSTKVRPGQFISLEVSLVNSNNNNSLITDTEAFQGGLDSTSLEAVFTSVCSASGDAGFSDDTFINNDNNIFGSSRYTDFFSDTGIYYAVYAPDNSCRETDTITVTIRGDLIATINIEIDNPEEILAIGLAEFLFNSDDLVSEVISYEDRALGTTVDTLSAGGQTIVTAHVVDRAQNDQLAESENTVVFTSPCVEAGLATITPSITTSTGLFFAPYEAQGCVGNDTITATLVIEGGFSPSASKTITVADDNPGGIQFESTDSPVLSINRFGSSTRPESTKVRFRVVDQQDLPVQGATVSFELSNTVGGTSLVSNTASVDSNGQAIATLVAGNVNSTVWVTASVINDAGDILSTSSDPISINTGLPDQNSFSLSADILAPRAADFDGTEVTVTIRGADAYNNPVRDGTVVNFRTESGSIEPTCTMASGACSVRWVSQNPRPENFFFDPIDFSAPEGNGGDARAVITAYTEGEEYLRADLNGNGLMDIGEPFESLPEVFEDINSDGFYDTAEGINGIDEYVDFNENGQYDVAGNLLYKGLRCSEAAIAAGHCANTVQVRDNLNLCISGGEPVITILSTDGGVVSYRVTDQFTNGLPTGSTLEITAENGDVFGDTLGETGAGPLGSCNEGFSGTATLVADPEATEPPAMIISVTAGQSGSSEELKLTFGI